jgi:hypothetical protein
LIKVWNRPKKTCFKNRIQRLRTYTSFRWPPWTKKHPSPRRLWISHPKSASYLFYLIRSHNVSITPRLNRSDDCFQPLFESPYNKVMILLHEELTFRQWSSSINIPFPQVGTFAHSCQPKIFSKQAWILEAKANFQILPTVQVKI